MSAQVAVTAAVITLNEASNIGPCLESAAWADERLVLDSGSHDGTLRICQSLPGVRLEHRPFDDYPHQRNAALRLAANDWVLFVDADERVTPELAAEVQITVAAAQHDGYYVPRFNHIMGRVMRHTGWYPDYQMRLLDRRHARYDEAIPVHEVVRLEHPVPGYLAGHFVHYNYLTLGQFMRKQRRYSDMEARRLRNQPPRLRQLLSLPTREFLRRYCTLRGYRDGGHGLLLSTLLAYYTLRAQTKALRAEPRGRAERLGAGGGRAGRG